METVRMLRSCRANCNYRTRNCSKHLVDERPQGKQRDECEIADYDNHQILLALHLNQTEYSRTRVRSAPELAIPYNAGVLHYALLCV